MLSPELQRAFSTALKAEQKPVQAMNEKKEKMEARIQLFNDVVGKVDGVKSLLPNLNSPIAIRELALASSDEKAISGTADKRLAQPGSHNIEILSLATQASGLSNGFPDKDSTRVGSGYLSFTAPDGESRDLFIDDENATLEGLARIINSSRLGIKAAVINDQSEPDNPFRLMITADGTGANEFEFPEFYFLDGEEELYIEKERPAANGLVRYEGHEIEIPSNTVNDLIPGVTLNLKGITDNGRPASITIEQDAPKTTVKVKDLVDKLNGVFSFIQSQNQLNEKSDTSRTLGGDYGIRLAEQRLRSALGGTMYGEEGRTIRALNDIGIQFNKSGTLTFDEKKFQASLNGHFDEVVDLLVGDGVGVGVIPRLTNALNSVAGTGGAVLTTQRDNEQAKVNRLQQDISTREKNAERRMEDLKGKLSRTQAAITKFQQQSGGFAGPQSQPGLPAQMVG